MLILLTFLLCLDFGLLVNGNKYNSFYSFKVKDIKGKVVDLKKYEGKVTLVVNVASDCEFSDAHYSALKRMQENFGSGGKFSVLGFPSNDFGNQEPGTDEELEEFINFVFQANFPIFSKRIIIGHTASAEWRFLAKESTAPTWNFHKYLIDHKGQVIDSWPGATSVESIEHNVKEALIDIGELNLRQNERVEL